MFKNAKGVGKTGQDKDLSHGLSDFQMHRELCSREQRLHTVLHCDRDNEVSVMISINTKNAGVRCCGRNVEKFLTSTDYSNLID